MGDHTWEPFTNVKKLESLDHYFSLMGVTWWQSLAHKPMINTQINPLQLLVRQKMGLRNRHSELHELGCCIRLANLPIPHAIFRKLWNRSLLNGCSTTQPPAPPQMISPHRKLLSTTIT